jgi:hypothetical protein
LSENLKRQKEEKMSYLTFSEMKIIKKTWQSFFCNQAIASLKFDISLQLNKCRCKWCDKIFKMFNFKTFFSKSVRYKLTKPLNH